MNVATLATMRASLLLGAVLPIQAEILLSETFTYPNGPLAQTPDTPWTTLTGTAAQIQVADSALRLTEGEFEIVAAPIAGQPYLEGLLYAGFTVTLSALPSGTGHYVAAFSDSNGPRTIGRIFPTLEGAAPGSFRLGGATALSFPTATFPRDLALNTAYRIVIRHGPANGVFRFWLDPVSEDEGGIFPFDATFPVSLAGFAFRQQVLVNGNSQGTVMVDDVVVATTFAEARSGPVTLPDQPVLESPRLVDGAFAVNARTRSGASYTLERQLAPLNNVWTPVETKPGNGETIVFTDPAASTAGAIYRLRLL